MKQRCFAKTVFATNQMNILGFVKAELDNILTFIEAIVVEGNAFNQHIDLLSL